MHRFVAVIKHPLVSLSLGSTCAMWESSQRCLESEVCVLAAAVVCLSDNDIHSDTASKLRLTPTCSSLVQDDDTSILYSQNKPYFCHVRSCTAPQQHAQMLFAGSAKPTTVWQVCQAKTATVTMLQAIARIYRYGQTRPTFVYRLLYKGTAEHRMYRRNVDKEGLFMRVVDKQTVKGQLSCFCGAHMPRHSFIHPLTHCSIVCHSSDYLLTPSLTRLLNHSSFVMHLIIHAFIHPSIHPSTHSS